MNNREMLGGNIWCLLETQPRAIAESFRRMLESEGIPSVLRTPFGWVMGGNVIETEAGIYQGDVLLYVPEVCFEAAKEWLSEA
jgi:hypothetical protein